MRSTGDLAPGDQVIAVGHPFGIGPSATAGHQGTKPTYAVVVLKLGAASNRSNDAGIGFAAVISRRPPRESLLRAIPRSS